MQRLLPLFILCAFVFFPRPAGAQLLIEEGKVKLSVSPAENIVNSITVHNTSNEEIAVKVYWQDFNYVEPFDGKKAFLPPGSIQNSMTKWITFSPQEFVLAPLSKRKVTYTINVPKDAQGGHYGVLFFEKGAKQTLDRTAVRLIARVGCLFFLESKDKKKTATVEALKVAGQRILGDLHNTGDVILLAQGIYYIMDKEGLVVHRGETDKMYLPPGAKSGFSASVAVQIPSGTYTLVLTFDLEDGDTLVKEIDFAKQNEAINMLQVRD